MRDINASDLFPVSATVAQLAELRAELLGAPLATVTVEPGDTLVVLMPVDTTRQALDEVAASVKDTPMAGRVLFIAGAEQLAVLKADRSVG